MVNYEVISIGLEVEFMIENKTCSGIVKYKGGLNGKEGVWIGIEAKEPVGYCDGRIKGVTYFKCQENFGLFLTADELRLVTHSKRKRKNTLYKSVQPSQCDDLLFKKHVPDNNIVCITEDYLKRAKSSFELGYQDIFLGGPRHVFRTELVCQKPKKPEEIKTVEKSFQPRSSIQRTFMPTEEMKLYTKLQWSYKKKNVNLPRNNDLSNTFESFNKNRSNYLGPTN